MEHLCLAGTNVYIIGPGSHGQDDRHAHTSIQGKNLLKILFFRTMSDDLETWHTGKGT